MLETKIKTSKEYLNKALAALDELEGRKGKGNEFLGWLDLPTETPRGTGKAAPKSGNSWKSCCSDDRHGMGASGYIRYSRRMDEAGEAA